MEIELVPEFGARLPGGALVFGATEAEARHLLEWSGQPPEPPRKAFAFGAAWSWRARVADRWVHASAGGDGLLGEIRVMRAAERADDEAAAVPGIPVRYRGIDVFALPITEVEFLLGPNPSSGRQLRLTGVGGYAQSATLTDPTRPVSATQAR